MTRETAQRSAHFSFFFGLVERQKKKKIKSFGQLNTGPGEKMMDE